MLIFFQLRDCELGAIVNRDLSRRVRTVSGLTSLKPVVQHDMKLSAKIIQNLDSKLGANTLLIIIIILLKKNILLK